jgi:hypothetical protein
LLFVLWGYLPASFSSFSVCFITFLQHFIILSHSYLSAYQGMIIIQTSIEYICYSRNCAKQLFSLDNLFDPHQNFVIEL